LARYGFVADSFEQERLPLHLDLYSGVWIDDGGVLEVFEELLSRSDRTAELDLYECPVGPIPFDLSLFDDDRLVRLDVYLYEESERRFLCTRAGYHEGGETSRQLRVEDSSADTDPLLPPALPDLVEP